MLGKIISIVGFLLYAAVMVLPLQGMSVLGGDRASVGAVVMLNWHPIVFVGSSVLAVAGLVTTFISQAKLKLIGILISAVLAVGALVFVLYLERGFNLLQIGWILSGILLAAGNWLVKR